MDEIVETLHEHGYVHGDLRVPNFIVDGERLCLVDFDWGELAEYPDSIQF
jgi:tRNA A-37 threonylcarbamoyl transferase component Bud32